MLTVFNRLAMAASRHIAIAVFAALISFAPGANSAEIERASASTVGLSQARLDKIRPHFQTYVDKKRLLGLTTAVAKNGKLVHFETYGSRTYDGSSATKEDTIYRIYSMTKPVTAVALMMLYEEGKFDLDDPLSKFIPAFAKQKVFAGVNEDGSVRYVDAATPITIRHLLTHTAGMTYGVFSDTPVDKAYRDANLFDAASLEEAIDQLAKLPLLFQPGTRWHYSVSVDVQGRLVEVLSGMAFEDFLQTRIFEPLGMVDTAFYVPADKLDRFSDMVTYHPETYEMIPYEGFFERGYKDAGGPPVKSGGGGLVSTTEDYMRFSLMMLRGGELNGTRLLKEETVALMTRDHLGPEVIGNSPPAVTGEWGFGLGYAVVLDPSKSDGLASVGEYNWGGAASTIFWNDPKRDIVAMVMTNLLVPSGTVKLREELRALLYAD